MNPKRVSTFLGAFLGLLSLGMPAAHAETHADTVVRCEITAQTGRMIQFLPPQVGDRIEIDVEANRFDQLRFTTPQGGVAVLAFGVGALVRISNEDASRFRQPPVLRWKALLGDIDYELVFSEDLAFARITERRNFNSTEASLDLECVR